MTLPAQLPPAQAPGPVRPTGRRVQRGALIVASLVWSLPVFPGMGVYTPLARPCISSDPAHHGLPCAAPLPAGAAFQSFSTDAYRNGEGSGQQETWTFSVPTANVRTVSDFY